MKAKKNNTYKSFEEKANKGNNAAKYLETGKGPDGMPLSAKTRAMYEKIAKRNKNVYLMSPAPFEDDGMRKKGGMMPKYKGGGTVHKDEMGREGHFNPFTKRTRGATSDRAETEGVYPKKYQNKIIGSYNKGSMRQKVGYQEDKIRSNHKYNSVMSLRADAYRAKENNFGIKKPKVKITK